MRNKLYTSSKYNIIFPSLAIYSDKYSGFIGVSERPKEGVYVMEIDMMNLKSLGKAQVNVKGFTQMMEKYLELALKEMYSDYKGIVDRIVDQINTASIVLI